MLTYALVSTRSLGAHQTKNAPLLQGRLLERSKLSSSQIEFCNFSSSAKLEGELPRQQEVLFPQFPARGEVHTKVPISLSGLWGVVHLPNDQGSIAALKWRRRRGSQPTSSNDKHLIGAVKAAGRGRGGEGCGGVRAAQARVWKVCVSKCPPPCSNDQHSIGAVKCLEEV